MSLVLLAVFWLERAKFCFSKVNRYHFHSRSLHPTMRNTSVCMCVYECTQCTVIYLFFFTADFSLENKLSTLHNFGLLKIEF